MPEKVHTKFGNDSFPPIPQSNSHRKFKNTIIDDRDPSKVPGPGQGNGIKRLRDGSPKPALDSKPPCDSTGPKTTNISPAKPSVPRSNDTSYKEDPPRTQTVPRASTTRGFNEATRKTVFTKGLLTGMASVPTHAANGASKHLSEKPNSKNLRMVALQLEKDRKNLPIWSKKADIRWALRNNDVLLLNGETGSGKSTQVPQFLCTEPWCAKKKVKIQIGDGIDQECSVGGMIAITQPRRVAAMTLAHRVAREMGSPLVKGGGPGQVGYAVRFDSLVPPGTKIKFVTEGLLLQEMLHDPHLRKYSAIIVDEVHERSIDVDLIVGFLRILVHGDKKGRGGIPLKVVVMSATLDLGGIEAFFSKPEVRPKYTPGKNHGKILAPHMPEYEVDGDLESEKSRFSSTESFSSWEGFGDSEEEARSNVPSGKQSKNSLKERSSKPSSKFQTCGVASEDLHRELPVSQVLPSSLSGDHEQNGVAVEYVRGRQYEVEIIYEAKPSPDYLHNMLQTILQLHVKEPLPGDILAFLTGQDEIETLRAELESYAEKLVKTLPRMKVMPLYGALSAQAQQAAFEKIREPFTRKVVLATNIAETSVTVSGVRFVVDCGKSKVKQYRPRLGMESLLAKPISRVSAIQRAGRAGREAKGKCFRIYTEEDYSKLEQDELPEIMRSDVVEAILKMKARGVDDILKFPLMDSPDPLAMEKALLQLHMMGALDEGGRLTDAGKKMATYPLPAAYGRVLIAAAEPESDVLLEAIDVISCLTADSDIFLQAKSEEDQESISETRKDILSLDGDVITLLTTMKRYASENADRGEWCRKRLISTRAMKMAMQIRKQLRQLCHQHKLLKAIPPPDPQPFQAISPERTATLLKTFLKAFVAKTALLALEEGYVMIQGRNPIAIHPSSVLYGQKKSEAIMFLDHVFTAKNYAKQVSPIQANWIQDALGA